MEDESVLLAGPLRLSRDARTVMLADTPVKLGNRAFDLLALLMDHPQRVLDKDEMIDAVWDGRAVSDGVLTTTMRELRRALGDNKHQPDFIETVHGRGYRFLLPVRTSADLPHAVEEAEAASVPGHRERAAGERPFHRRPAIVLSGLAAACLLIAGLLIAGLWVPGWLADDGGAGRPAPSGPNKTVTVLPFSDLSGDTAYQWFADGLTEELTATLVRNPGLKVLSAGNTAQEAGIMNATQAGHILQGSVRHDDSRLRVNVRLIATGDGQTIWAEIYDRPVADIIRIQEDIASEISKALRTVMDPQQLASMTAAGTRSVEAYEAMLTGHHYMYRQYLTGETRLRRQAYDAYERARTLDPGFGEAHWLAARYWLEQATFISPPGAADSADPVEIRNNFLERINAAMENAPEPLTRLKYESALLFSDHEYIRAGELLEEYLTARPSDAFAWVQMARIAAYVGDFETGRKAAAEVARLSDRNTLYFERVVPIHYWVRDFDGAARHAGRTLEAAADNAFVQYQAHRAYLWAGDTQSARALLPAIEAGSLPPHNRLLAVIRQACADGELETARAAHRELSALPGASLATRWLAEMLFSDREAARALLLPYDEEDKLMQLASWMIYPHFDSREYPVLTRHLTAAGIDRPPPLPMPFSCAAE